MAEESSTPIALLGAITALLSLVVAVVSAAAARRSANAAETSARHAHATEIRSLVRHVVTASQGVTAERNRLEAAASRLVNGYQTLFALSGHSKVKDQPQIRSVEERKSELPDFAEEAIRLVEDPVSLRQASAEDLAATIAKLQGHLVRLTALRQEFESEWTSVEEQIRPLRERALAR